MQKPGLILALLVLAWAAWSEFGSRSGLPGQGVSLRPSGDGRDTPAAAGIVTGGAGEAARGLGN